MRLFYKCSRRQNVSVNEVYVKKNVQCCRAETKYEGEEDEHACAGKILFT